MLAFYDFRLGKNIIFKWWYGNEKKKSKNIGNDIAISLGLGVISWWGLMLVFALIDNLFLSPSEIVVAPPDPAIYFDNATQYSVRVKFNKEDEVIVPSGNYYFASFKGNHGNIRIISKSKNIVIDDFMINLSTAKGNVYIYNIGGINSYGTRSIEYKELF